MRDKEFLCCACTWERNISLSIHSLVCQHCCILRIQFHKRRNNPFGCSIQPYIWSINSNRLITTGPHRRPALTIQKLQFNKVFKSINIGYNFWNYIVKRLPRFRKSNKPHAKKVTLSKAVYYPENVSRQMIHWCLVISVVNVVHKHL